VGLELVRADERDVIALAYDFSKDSKYLNGVAMGMDYVLGRNATRPELR
jgi:endoglucanase